MKVALLAHTPEPERLVAAAARNCYSNQGAAALFDALDEEKAGEFLDMFTLLGHDSLSEHASFTFAIEGVSRVLLAQLTRHRIASFSVKSQRYTSERRFEAVTPPEIAAIPEARTLYEQGVEDARARYNALVELLTAQHVARLTAAGESPEAARKKAQKQAGEDARYLLPSACETNIVVTMNARELRHFFALRICRRAQWEIRELATEMLRLVLGVAPRLFADAGPGCVRGACPEGAYSCGQPGDVRVALASLKNV